MDSQDERKERMGGHPTWAQYKSLHMKLEAAKLDAECKVLCVQRVMTRLADLLQDDDFNTLERWVLEAGFPYPPLRKVNPQWKEPRYHCQNGSGDICLAGNRDGIACPHDSCDIDDAVRPDPRDTKVPT